MLTIGVVLTAVFAMCVIWAVTVACESCAMTEPVYVGMWATERRDRVDPMLESIGLAKTSARAIGIRLGKAPNPAVRHARYRALARSGLGADSLRWANARMCGAAGWRDLAGHWHAFPSKARMVEANEYMGYPIIPMG